MDLVAVDAHADVAVTLDGVLEGDGDTRFLLGLAARLTRERDIEALVLRIADEAMRACGAEVGALVYLDGAARAEGKVPRCARAGATTVAPLRDRQVADGRGGSASANAESSGSSSTSHRWASPPAPRPEILRCDDLAADPALAASTPFADPTPGTAPVRSYLACPLGSRSAGGEERDAAAAGTVEGRLCLGHSRPGAFTAASERLLSAIAELATAAIENALLLRRLRDAESEQRRRARQAEMAAEVGAALTRAGADPREMLQKCVQSVVRHLDAAFARVWTLNEAEQVLELQASDGLYTHIDGPHARVPVGSFKIGRIAAQRRPHLSNDVLHDPEVSNHEWAAREGMVAFAGYPLMLDDRLVGVVALFAREPLTDDALHALSSIATTLAMGIVRKRAEESMRASEHRYAQILDSVQDMVFCKAPGSKIVYANKAACAYYGLTLDELRGLTDVSHNADSFTSQYLRDDQQVFDRGEPVEALEEPNQRADGEVRFFHTIKSPIRDRAGRVTELVGVSRDITDRKRAEDDRHFLYEASRLLSSSLESEATLSNVAALAVPRMADWCVVDMVEPDGRLRQLEVLHSDPAKVELARELRRRFPPSPDQPHGVPRVVRTGVAEVSPEITDEMLAAASSTSDPGELALIRKLGLRSYACVPMMLHGRALGAITLVTAESRRRFSEADLPLLEDLAGRAALAVENARLYAEVRRWSATLERKVEERTEQLTEVNRELESFSYTVSHDLRAPIRHIAGFVDLIQRANAGKLDARSAQHLVTVAEAANQMGRLIDALLAFSRMGRAEIMRARVDLAQVVSAVLKEQQPDLEGRRVEWEIGALPEVEGDPAMLRIVLSNLVSNALKYSRGRAVAHLAVGTLPDAGTGAEHVLFVRDDGVGFNMDYHHKLFGVFQRLHADKEFEGTGIGLATVRRIVARHGGRTWAEAKEGQGATFFFSLPRRSAAPPAATKATTTAGATTADAAGPIAHHDTSAGA